MRILEELLLIDPLAPRKPKTFYTSMLRSRGIGPMRMADVAHLLNTPPELNADLKRIENASVKSVIEVAAEVLERWPTSIRVLMTIGQCLPKPEHSCLCAMTVRQLADPFVKPLNVNSDADIEKVDPSLFALRAVGLDMLFDSLSELGAYDVLEKELIRSMNLSPETGRWVLIKGAYAVCGYQHQRAEELFDVFVEGIEMSSDLEMQTEACIARCLHAFLSDDVSEQITAPVHRLFEVHAGLKEIFKRPDCLSIVGNAHKKDNGSELAFFMMRFADLDATYPGFAGWIHGIAVKGHVHNQSTSGQPLSSNPMKDLHRLMDRQTFSSMEEAQEWMNSMIGKRVPEIPLEELTSDEIAEDLCEEVKGLTPHERIIALHGIANDHPQSLWPMVYLAELATDARDMLRYSESGLLRGAHFETADFLSENTGHFWGITQTRPYMRLLMHKGYALYQLGRKQEAIEVYDRGIMLNPSDNLGLRWVLLSMLLERGMRQHIERASGIILSYADDDSAQFLWSVLLYKIVTKSSRQEILQSCIKAGEANVLIGYLLAEPYGRSIKILMERAPDFVVQEAFEYMQVGKNAWEKNTDALKQLKKLVGMLDTSSLRS